MLKMFLLYYNNAYRVGGHMSFEVRTNFNSSQAQAAYTDWYNAICALNNDEKKAAQAGKPCGYGHGNAELDAEYDYVKGLEGIFHKIDDNDAKTSNVKISQNASNQNKPSIIADSNIGNQFDRIG